jgi:hypothetical protein
MYFSSKTLLCAENVKCFELYGASVLTCKLRLLPGWIDEQPGSLQTSVHIIIHDNIIIHIIIIIHHHHGFTPLPGLHDGLTLFSHLVPRDAE